MILKANLRRTVVTTEEERKEWIPPRHQKIQTWEIARNGMRVVFSGHMYRRVNFAHDPRHPVHPGIARVLDSAAEEMVEWFINRMKIDANHPRRFYREMKHEYYINATSNENQYGDILFKFEKRKNFREISGPDIILNINSWKLHVATATRSFVNMVRPHGIANRHITTAPLQEYLGGAIQSAVEQQQALDAQEAEEAPEAEEAEEAPEVDESTDFQAKLDALKTTMVGKLGSLQLMSKTQKDDLIRQVNNVTLEENTKENLLSAGVEIQSIVSAGAIPITWGKDEDRRYFTNEHGYVSSTIDNWEKLLRSLLSIKSNLTWESIIKLDDRCCKEARSKVVELMDDQLANTSMTQLEGILQNMLNVVHFFRTCSCAELKIGINKFIEINVAESLSAEAQDAGMGDTRYHNRLVDIRDNWDKCEEQL